MRNSCWALALLMIVSSNIAAGVNSPQKSFSTNTFSRISPVQKEFFGLIIHRAHITTRWPALAFGSLRLWDSYLKWMDIQPAPNTWNFDNFDRQVELAIGQGVEMIHTLGQTPTWATVTPAERHAYGLGSGGMPHDLANWRTYVAKVASRYRGKIAGYEIWNEPKYSEGGKCKGTIFFCGSPEDLVKLTEIAYSAIKQADPNALVLSPGFTDGLHGVARLDQYLAAGGGKYIEAVSFHFYELRPEKAWETYSSIQTVLKKYGLGHIPIWNTEVGYLIQSQDGSIRPEHPQGPFSIVLTPDEAAGYLARGMLVSASAGAARAYWYAWDNKRMGLTGTQDGIPHAAATGYRIVRRWLVGSTIECGKFNAAVWQCRLYRNGRAASVYWAEDGPQSIALPGAGDSSLEDLTEGRHKISRGSEVRWDGRPILLSEDGAPWHPKTH